MKVSVEKPGSPIDILEHHGIKGMKWGVRSGSAASRNFNRKNPTSRAKAADIRRARAASQVRYTKFHNEPKGPKRQQLKTVYLKHPDRATALRMTRGEKVVTALLAGAFAVPTSGTTLAIAGVAGAGQVATRKAIERKQARGR